MPELKPDTFVLEARYRISLIFEQPEPARRVTGLYTCTVCTRLLGAAFNHQPAVMVLYSPSQRPGEACDICPIVNRLLAEMIEQEVAEPDLPDARQYAYEVWCEGDPERDLDDGGPQRRGFTAGWVAGRFWQQLREPRALESLRRVYETERAPSRADAPDGPESTREEGV